MDYSITWCAALSNGQHTTTNTSTTCTQFTAQPLSHLLFFDKVPYKDSRLCYSCGKWGPFRVTLSSFLPLHFCNKILLPDNSRKGSAPSLKSKLHNRSFLPNVGICLYAVLLLIFIPQAKLLMGHSLEAVMGLTHYR